MYLDTLDADLVVSAELNISGNANTCFGKNAIYALQFQIIINELFQ